MTRADRSQWVFYFGKGHADADRNLTHLVGGKGASLAVMTRAGLPVPPGFTISAECCRYFLENDGAWPEGLEEQIRQNLAHLEQETGRKLGHQRHPLLLAVRSGAAVSMPGMMDTLLNCCAPTPNHPPSEASAWQALVGAINAVFRSWNSERAIAYRHQHDIRDTHGTAVTVQAMFPSQVSGVMFTRDPTDPTADHMVIEAASGLGDALVSGKVVPHRFTVSRQSLECLQAAVGEGAAGGPMLTSEQLSELGQLGLRVETLFGRPMDIEWGWADGQFVLFQCRPISGLEVAEEVEISRQAEIARLREIAGERPKLWVAHNLGETLRCPTPLTWDIIRHFMSGAGGFGLMYRDLGYRPSRAVCENGFLELICGRPYADPQRLAQLFWGEGPVTYDIHALQRDPSLLDRTPAYFDPERVGPSFLVRLPGLLRTLVVTTQRIRRDGKTIQAAFERNHVQPFLGYVAQARAQDLTTLPTEAVIAELHERCRHVLDDFGKESLKPGFFGGMAFASLEETLAQLMGHAEGSQLARTLTIGLEGDITIEQSLLLQRVADGEATMDEFLERFGHRAAGEMELSQPRWREDRSYLERVLKGLRRERQRSPQALHAENVRRRQQAEKELPEILARWGGSSFREEVEEHLRLAQSLLPYRETGKHYLMMGYELIRLAILELARRWGLGRDIFFLHLDELEQFESERDKLEADIRQRKTRWRAFQRLDLPQVITSDELDQLGLPQEYDTGAVIEAQPIAPGVATGRAMVVLAPGDAGVAQDDYLLVCPSTDPGWAPLLIHARGLIVERGGVLSHGAIVARDMGIPAVVCPGATTRLTDGQRVRLDGNRGQVTILEVGSPPNSAGGL